jgi:hypothetical protein
MVSLNLETSVGTRGVKDLAAALITNTTLEALNLKGN